MGDHSASASALLKTLTLFKDYLRSLPKPLLNRASSRILKARILCKLHLQLFSAFSKLESHEAALVQCQSALRKSQSIVHNSLRACQEHLFRHKAMSASSVSCI